MTNLPPLFAVLLSLEQVALCEFPSKRSVELAVALCREFACPTPDGCDDPPKVVAKRERKPRKAYRVFPKPKVKV